MIGVPETLTEEFADLVQFGHIRHDWRTLYAKAMAQLLAPVGSLIGKPHPTHTAPSQPLHHYVGTYRNKYFGPLQVIEDHGHLKLRLGPKQMEWPLTHWGGEIFTFRPRGENSLPGTISMARFLPGKVVLEYFDNEGLGTFIRQTENHTY